MKTIIHGELFSRFDEPQSSVGTAIGRRTVIHETTGIGGIRTEHIGIIGQDKSLSQENPDGFPIIAAAGFDGANSGSVVGRLLMVISPVDDDVLLYVTVQLVLAYLMHAIRPFPKFGVGRYVDESEDSLVIGTERWSHSDFHRTQKGGECGKQQRFILDTVFGGWHGRRLQNVGIFFEERHTTDVVGLVDVAELSGIVFV